MAIDVRIRIHEISNLQAVLEVVHGVADIMDIEFIPEEKPQRKRTVRHRPSNGAAPAPVQLAAFLASDKPALVTRDYVARWCSRSGFAQTSASSLMSVLARNNVLTVTAQRGSYIVAPQDKWNVGYTPKKGE